MVSVYVTCAPSAPEALCLARPGALVMTRARQGRQSAVPTADTAERRPCTPGGRECVNS
ncbi:hypothetical protein AB0J21_33475 [Streptomyces sp. NPDC049954]|uniref:hypothetical protein n=1 Tax=Streptomyces sp. NPDC049954 TaxID=3155779 RepID=UPI0034150283